MGWTYAHTEHEQFGVDVIQRQQKAGTERQRFGVDRFAHRTSVVKRVHRITHLHTTQQTTPSHHTTRHIRIRSDEFARPSYITCGKGREGEGGRGAVLCAVRLTLSKPSSSRLKLLLLTYKAVCAFKSPKAWPFSCAMQYVKASERSLTQSGVCVEQHTRHDIRWRFWSRPCAGRAGARHCSCPPLRAASRCSSTPHSECLY